MATRTTTASRIHYVSLGEGPLVVMIHGFPDFWYTWRDQMEALSSDFRVVAVDLRGYNKSDKPDGVAAYAMPNHIADIAAVIKDTGSESAAIVGHDWGGAVAWSFALARPAMTDKLVILNLPHFNGLTRELVENPQQYENSAYARAFQTPGHHPGRQSLRAAGRERAGDGHHAVVASSVSS